MKAPCLGSRSRFEIPRSKSGGPSRDSRCQFRLVSGACTAPGAPREHQGQCKGAGLLGLNCIYREIWVAGGLLGPEAVDLVSGSVVLDILRCLSGARSGLETSVLTCRLCQHLILLFGRFTFLLGPHSQFPVFA